MDTALLSAATAALVDGARAASTAGRLDQQLPAEVDPSGQAATVRQVLSGVAYDLAFVPHTLSGRPLDDQPPAERGQDLLGADPAAALAELADRAIRAVAEHADPGSSTHLTYGDLSASGYLRDITGYYGLVALDVAGVTGLEPSTALVEGLWEHLAPVAQDWRALGIIGARVPVDDAAPPLDRLRGLLGRHP